MESVRAIGIRTNDPPRVEVALDALKTCFGPPLHADAYGVATFVDDTVLLKRVPGALGEKSLADLAANVKGTSALVQVRAHDELRPNASQSTDINLGPYRIRHFCAAIAGGPQNADEASAEREELLAALPEFMRRSVIGQNAAEVFFLNVVAEIYQYEGIEQKYPASERIAEVIRALEQKLGGKHPRAVLFATGREVVQVSHKMPSAVVIMNGLSLEMAESRSPDFIDSATARERLRQFKGSFAFAGLSAAPKADLPLPTGATLKSFAEDAVMALGKDASVRFI